MSGTLPKSADSWLDAAWRQIRPHYESLEEQELSPQTVGDWMARWNALQELLSEVSTRLRIATDLDTSNEEKRRKYLRFEEEVASPAEEAEQRLRLKLLGSGLTPKGCELPLKELIAEVEIFSEKNLPLHVRETELESEYAEVVGGQSVIWDGRELNLVELAAIYSDPDRSKREAAWRCGAERQLRDRERLYGIWRDLVQLRHTVAANAGMNSYRSYVWKDRARFDYTPNDCVAFSDAIEEVIVPITSEIYRRHANELGLSHLRPWDLIDGWYQNPVRLAGEARLRGVPTSELIEGAVRIFNRIDPELGAQFVQMKEKGLLDLDTKKGKAPGAYCANLDTVKMPFVMMNGSGVFDDIVTLFHECGHAFHAFSTYALPYDMQRNAPMEFSEVASMAMEHLALEQLESSRGGYFSYEEAEEARRSHLEELLLFWPFMAVVDRFQHWVYEHPTESQNGASCDATWDALWKRFIPAVDWSGLEEYRMTGWLRKHHIFDAPFYYVEYGLARVGALQVWRNYKLDPAKAVRSYRDALSLGCTRPLPELFRTAGGEFGWHRDLLRDMVKLAGF